MNKLPPEGLAPLFCLPLVVYRITCEVSGKPDNSFSSPLRGGIGFYLRKECCAFQDFRRRPCEECPLAGSCGYVQLFAPLPPPPTVDRHGKLRLHRPPPRPFALSSGIVKDDEKRMVIDLVLFGPALKQASFFLTAAVRALRKIKGRWPVTVHRVVDVTPAFPAHIQNSTAAATGLLLADWLEPGTIQLQRQSAADVTVHCLTPVCLSPRGNYSNAFSLELLARNIIRRLRDLKRTYGVDTKMGQLDGQLFVGLAAVENRANHLQPCTARRYSFRQHQPHSLHGQCGQAVFGHVPPGIVPLLQAAEIIHVGKGSSWGLGKIILNP